MQKGNTIKQPTINCRTLDAKIQKLFRKVENNNYSCKRISDWQIKLSTALSNKKRIELCSRNLKSDHLNLVWDTQCILQSLTKRPRSLCVTRRKQTSNKNQKKEETKKHSYFRRWITWNRKGREGKSIW